MSDSGLLSPEDFQYFTQNRRRVNQTYALNLAQNNFQRDAAGNAYGRNIANLTRQFDQMRQRLPWRYTGRGLQNSGIYQRGLQDYAGDRTRAFGQMAGAYQDQVGGFDIAQQQLGQVKDWAGEDLDEQEATRKAQVAAMLKAAR